MFLPSFFIEKSISLYHVNHFFCQRISGEDKLKVESEVTSIPVRPIRSRGQHHKQNEKQKGNHC